MADKQPPELREEVSGDASYYKDPKPIVNYTVGMIVAFVIIALIAIFIIGVYYSTSQSGGRGTDAGQSEQRANP